MDSNNYEIRVRHNTKAKSNGALQIDCSVEIFGAKGETDTGPECCATRYVLHLAALVLKLKEAGFVIAGEDTKK